MDERKRLHHPPISLDPLIHQRLSRGSNNIIHPTTHTYNRRPKLTNSDSNKMLQRPTTKKYFHKKRLTFRLLII